MDITTTILEFINRLRVEGFSKYTIVAYTNNLDQFRRYLAKRNINDIKQITRTIVIDYQANIMSLPVAIETKGIKLKVVRRLFGYLVENKKLLIDPTESIAIIKRRTRKNQTVLTSEEIEELRSLPDLTNKLQSRNRAIIEVLYSCALRINELVNLNLNDSDMEEKVLYIRKGKGDKDRTVPIGKLAMKYLKKYLTEIRPWYVKRNPYEQRLFVNRSGRPLGKGSIRAFLRKYRIQAEIKKSISPHTFRRTCATHFLKNGADIRYVQELLGHKSLRTTQEYTRINSSEIKEIHNKTHPGINIRNDKGENHDN